MSVGVLYECQEISSIFIPAFFLSRSLLSLAGFCGFLHARYFYNGASLLVWLSVCVHVYVGTTDGVTWQFCVMPSEPDFHRF